MMFKDLLPDDVLREYMLPDCVLPDFVLPGLAVEDEPFEHIHCKMISSQPPKRF